MQHLKGLYMFLREDPEIQKYLGLIEKMFPVFLEKRPEEFAVSPEMEFITSELEKLRLQKLEEILLKIPTVPHITAVILKACQAYTIAFLIIPAATVFHWHDHKNMNGISRCVSGKLFIRSLNPSYLEPTSLQTKTIIGGKQSENEQYFEYPVDRIREQSLDPRSNKISLIYPDSYNIHEIRSSATHQSAFIDSLMPEYPDNSCNFYQTISTERIAQDDEVMRLKKVKEGEKIIGFDTLIKLLKTKEMEGKQQGKSKQKE